MDEMTDAEKRAEALRLHRLNQPKFLYKYRAGNELDLDALRQRKVWISSFSLLNDPHDGDLDIVFDSAVKLHNQHPGIPFSDEFGEVTLLMHLPRFGFGDPLKQPEPDPAVVAKYAAEAQAIKLAIQQYGIYSLTTTCVNEHMWAHYGAGHQGYCIEYPCVPEVFDAEIGRNPVYKMNYIDRYPRHELAVLRLEPFPIILWKMLQHKSKRYESEDEWRMFFGKADFLATLALPISSIIFGVKAKPKLINDVRGFFSDGPEVEFKQVKKIKGSFDYETVAL